MTRATLDTLINYAIALCLMVLFALVLVAFSRTSPFVPRQSQQPIIINVAQPVPPTAVAPIQPKTAVNGLIQDLVPTMQPTVQPPTTTENQAVQPAQIVQPTLLPNLAAACEAAKTSGRRQSPKCRDVANGVGR